MEPTTLTCNFSVDVSATKRDFRVIHFNSQDKKGGEILSCTWTSDQLFCNKAPGFEFNKSVTDHLFIEVPQARQEHNGSYTCYLEGSDRQESCDFIVMTASQNTDNAAAVSVGVIIPLLIIVALIVIVFVFKRRSRTRKENTDIEENEDMLSQMSEADSDCFQKKYPGYESKSYYVPPLYFNRNTYTTFRIAGEDVSVTEFPDDHTVKLDQAMSTIFKSFRLLGKKHIMFVISQFDYDDCLEYLRQDSSKRREVKNYGDFDVLIVHRRYGVLVGVVMTCNDKTNKMVMVKDLEKSCQQLDNAYQMLVDLTTDQQPKISIHKLLILPNLQHKSLKSVFRQNTNAKKVLADCLELSKLDNVHQKCLCADDLQGNNRTQKLGEWLEKQVSTSQECIPDDKYVEVLERFCGHTIKMPLIPRGILPTTLRAAVNVTGNLFSLPILQPEQRDALQNVESQPSVQEVSGAGWDCVAGRIWHRVAGWIWPAGSRLSIPGLEHLVFLSGPPASGKTRTLVLTGKQWLYDGHDVHVVSTWRGSRTASSMIHAELSKYVENMTSPTKIGEGHPTRF
ncbi:uncharacterized protein LOC112576073 isoform X2 [Pomacea canaliculata]|nr:uncharacterized protein LOC112576073 isoform X2 [Pomacea canaliculata]